jgi:hypothetical protein
MYFENIINPSEQIRRVFLLRRIHSDTFINKNE